MTPTPLTRDEIIARNLAAVADHFANENPDGIARVIAGYTDDIVREGPARGILIRDKLEVQRAYLRLFESMDVHKVTHLYRFATEDWAFESACGSCTRSSCAMARSAARTATKYGATPTIPSSLTTSRPDRTRRPSDNANTRARPSLRRHVLEHLATGTFAPKPRNSRLSPVRWRARNKLGSEPINDPQAG